MDVLGLLALATGQQCNRNDSGQRTDLFHIYEVLIRIILHKSSVFFIFV